MTSQHDLMTLRRLREDKPRPEQENGVPGLKVRYIYGVHSVLSTAYLPPFTAVLPSTKSPLYHAFFLHFRACPSVRLLNVTEELGKHQHFDNLRTFQQSQRVGSPLVVRVFQYRQTDTNNNETPHETE